MFGALDILVLASYLALVVGIGLWAGRGQKTTEDYFLGGHRIPWWAAGLSIIATETSALTFLGAPTQSLRGDWTYLQLAFGSVLARFLVASLLIGVYYRARVFTVYSWLEIRFGSLTKNLASALFFVGRSLGSGVRLYGAAIALVVVADMPFALAIAAIAALAVFYTIVGGIRSVIWTDIVQGLLLVGGGAVALWFLISGLDGGFTEFWEKISAGKTGGDAPVSKLRVFDFSLDPKQAFTLVGGLFGATFLTLATHGTDQDMIQRALTCEGEAGGKRSMWLSAFLNIPIVVLFLAVGSALWVHYGGDAEAARVAAGLAEKAGEPNPRKGFDYIFLHYVVLNLPGGVRGLIVAAVFAAAMSSLDSAIAALSSTAVKNVWEPYLRPGRDEAYYLRVARIMAVVFGLLLTGIAILVWLSKGSGSEREGFGVLMLGLKVLTWIFPPLLGIFLLGVLTKRGSELGNLVAVASGVGLLLVVEFWGELMPGTLDAATGEFVKASPPFAWVWNSAVGCLVTLGVGALFPAPRPKDD